METLWVDGGRRRSEVRVQRGLGHRVEGRVKVSPVGGGSVRVSEGSGR